MSLANSKINISLDGWRSPNRDDYIAICAHFINDYEIGGNLGGFMMDNAGDNDTALQALAEEFDFDVDFSRLRCLGPIINLVVKALLFGKGVSKVERELVDATGEAAFKIWNKQGPIGRLHNICVYVNTNSTRHTAFKDCQGEEIQVYKLLTDGGIRWNSTEAMISRGMFPDVHLQYLCYWLIWLLNISHQTPCSDHPLPTSVETLDAYGLRQDFLTGDDWADLTRWQRLLVPFRELCEQEEGRAQKLGEEGRYGTLWRVLHSMNFMSDVLEKAQDENGPQVDLEQTEHFNTTQRGEWNISRTSGRNTRSGSGRPRRPSRTCF